MKSIRITPVFAAVATAALVLSLAACGSDPTKTDTGTTPTSSGGNVSIVVGSASFGESEILAEIYAQALSAKGINASTHLDIGQREAYIGALQDGSINLFPEYSGNLLTYFDPQATATSPDDVVAALKAALPDELEVLTPSSAEDKDSYNVTSELASQYGLKTIADLKKVPDLSLAGNPELQTRVYGVPGLEKVYGLDNIKFTAISDSGGPATLKALTQGKVDVADIYSTTPSITDNHLVTLDDPEHLVAAQQVIPLIRKDADSDTVTQTLNAVSAKLTTQALLELNAKLNGPDKPKASDVAADWLQENGLA